MSTTDPESKAARGAAGGDVERVVFESLGLDLVAWALGDRDKPPLVCVHGYLDQGRSFLPTARRLAADYRVIMPDLRGHGESGRVGPGGYYHFPDYALDLQALMDHLGLERAAFVGHSMGASVVTYFAGACPERATAVAMLDAIGPVHMPIDTSAELMRAFLRDTPHARLRPEPAMEDLAHVVARMRRAAPLGDDAVLTEIAGYATSETAAGERVWRFDPLHRTRGAIPFDERRFAVFLAAITCPTLVVWGERSPFRVPGVEARAQQLRDVTTATLPDLGHNMHHERPEALGELLRSFLVNALP
ncbi:MAG: alpha/beta hydrolase [Deltaproteobacteria bacterium]|nr:alpha/beta hydrolase [Deltaproteobacteria bacterium]